jgi:hypothetical protein
LLVGAVKEIVACVSPTTAVTAEGAFGTVEGVTAADATDTTDVPTSFVAVTLNVYSSPFVKPLIAQVSAVVVVQVAPDTKTPAL